jgi:hypothetical protein
LLGFPLHTLHGLCVTAHEIFNESVDLLAAYFTGKRLELFLASVAVVRESVTQGGWLSRGHQRASKGFNKGLASRKALRDLATSYDDPRRWPLHNCWMALSFGSHLRQEDLDVATDDDLIHFVPGAPLEITWAWLRLMVAVREIFADLDASRPLPVYTEIGLSPKVTATLLDAALDLDLTTRRVCPLGWRWIDARDKHGEIIIGRDGKPKQIKFYFPKWPEGTVFGSSRFANCDCEACGKTIPSGLVVPILITAKSGTLHGFWFGRDCASNILGIKDAGINKET